MGSTRVTSRTAWRSAAAVAVVALTGLAACSGGVDGGGGGGDGDAATSATFAAGGMPATTMPGALLSSGAEQASGDAADMAAPPAPSTVGGTTVPRGLQVDAAIAVTAQTRVQATDVRDAVARITRTVEARGGRVAAADVDFGTPPADGTATAPPTGRATLVVAVPPNELAGVRSVLDEIGDVLTFDQQAEDVTDQLADLETRVANQRASVERIRELYATATDVDAIVRIEGELTARETMLEQLLAVQANLAGRVAMSTLTIDITTTPVPVAADDGGSGLGDALGAGWSAFAGALFAIALALTAALPFLLLGAVVGLVLWLVLRRRPTAARRTHREPEPATSADDTPSVPTGV